MISKFIIITLAIASSLISSEGQGTTSPRDSLRTIPGQTPLYTSVVHRMAEEQKSLREAFALLPPRAIEIVVEYLSSRYTLYNTITFDPSPHNQIPIERIDRTCFSENSAIFKRYFELFSFGSSSDPLLTCEHFDVQSGKLIKTSSHPSHKKSVMKEISVFINKTLTILYTTKKRGGIYTFVRKSTPSSMLYSHVIFSPSMQYAALFTQDKSVFLNEKPSKRKTKRAPPQPNIEIYIQDLDLGCA